MRGKDRQLTDCLNLSAALNNFHSGWKRSIVVQGSSAKLQIERLTNTLKCDALYDDSFCAVSTLKSSFRQNFSKQSILVRGRFSSTEFFNNKSDLLLAGSVIQAFPVVPVWVVKRHLADYQIFNF
jgi:hypothetical protein